MAGKRKTPQKAPETGARERILASAGRLFYERGFDATGINEVLSDSAAFKASLYHHFSSKADLGAACLRDMGVEFTSLCQRLSRNSHYRDFVVAWTRLIKRRATRGPYFGCPVAGFAAQTPDRRALYQPEFRAIVHEWERLLGEFFELEIGRGHFRADADPQQLARLTLQLYEGAMTLLSMTGEVDHIDSLKRTLLVVLDAHA